MRVPDRLSDAMRAASRGGVRRARRAFEGADPATAALWAKTGVTAGWRVGPRLPRGRRPPGGRYGLALAGGLVGGLVGALASAGGRATLDDVNPDLIRRNVVDWSRAGERFAGPTGRSVGAGVGAVAGFAQATEGRLHDLFDVDPNELGAEFAPDSNSGFDRP